MSFETTDTEIDELVELHRKTEERLESELTEEQWRGVQEYVELEIQLQELDGR